MRSERWNTEEEIRQGLVNDEPHIGVFGRTGKGKSQCVSLRHIRQILEKRESMLVLDPKGEGYHRNACYVPEEYQFFCLDFRNPRKSPTKWNPMHMPYKLFQSEDPDDQDIACSQVSEFWSGVYPYDANDERFWIDASINLARGLTYGLFENAREDEVNLSSVATMMEQAEVCTLGTPQIRSFYDNLEEQSLARSNLATYVTAPSQTRASIHSVATAGIEVFSRSRGLMEMLSSDTLDIMNLDVNRPFAVFVIIPDETSTYDRLAGLLVTQIAQYLIQKAHERGGRLPIRVNFILEELGSVGRSIPELPNLMVAGRSRNIRLMLVLQSHMQLLDIYGKSKAETILDNIGITVGFSTNSWETLEKWSQQCGMKQIEAGGRLVQEPLITPTQLAAMPTGWALVMIDSRYKIIARLPFYDELYDRSDWKEPPLQPENPVESREPFQFSDLIQRMHHENVPSYIYDEEERKIMMERLNHAVERIGRERKWRNKRLSPKIKKKTGKHEVVIRKRSSKTAKIARKIGQLTGESAVQALSRMRYIPCIIPFSKKKDAKKVVKMIRAHGGKAEIVKRGS